MDAETNNKLVLLDSLSLLNRAYHAMSNTYLTDTDGNPVGAVFGFTNMLSKLIKESGATHMVACFDVKAPTFRHLKTPLYKATRKPQPEDLTVQIPVVKQLLTAMNIAIVELAGYEADDVIGTLAKKTPFETIIVTGDKDSLQLIDDTTTVWLTKKGISEIVVYDEARLAEEGLKPYQVIELKSLMGDASDNIPGVLGVGEKTARTLLAKYVTLDGVYQNLEKESGKLKEKLIQHKEDAYLSHFLATIDVNVPLSFDLDGFKLRYPFDMEVKQFFARLKFTSAIGRFKYAEAESAALPQNDVIVEKEAESVTIETEAELDSLLGRLSSAPHLAVVAEGDILEVAESADVNYTIKVADNFLSPLFLDNVMQRFAEVLGSPSTKIVYNSKQFRRSLLQDYGITPSGEIIDVSLALYVLNCDENQDSFSAYAKKNAIEKNYATTLLRKKDAAFSALEKDETAKKLYCQMELPLSDVLYDMEIAGVGVNKELLKQLAAKYEAELKELSAEIYNLAGKPFNINSPKQLGEVLFVELGLKNKKKTKSGTALSSGIEVLQELVDAHPIVPLLIRYRTASKLQSTYCVGLQGYVKSDGKIHTTFRQNLTNTGRLSSAEPNLQNIPVRSEEGAVLRGAFIASKGNVLVVADYSQIELRVLAGLSQDENLINAFLGGKDIHRYTASLVYGVPEEMVTHAMRSASKAVNFGIVYGMSDFGLSNEIGVSVPEARRFIERYFATYPKVQGFMDGMVEAAKQKGYAETLFGRRRNIAELKSDNFNVRKFGERAAKNMPLQGTAADIMKLAMLKVASQLNAEGLEAKPVLQIHDELVIDTPPGEAQQVAALLKRCMESAADIGVPLVAEVGIAQNWLDAK